MYQIRRLLLGTIMSAIISLWISHAWGVSMSPSTWTFGMRCIYPINFSVNVSGIESKAVDMRVLYSGDIMQFTGDGTGQIAYGTSLVRTGTTTIATDLWRATYGIGSKYRLFNRTDLVTPLTWTSDIPYYTRYFQTTANVLTWNLDFYYSGGRNGDDSNIQSGVVNNFVDVLDTINSWYYQFVARPCILDVDPALFTWYASGATQSYLSGIAFTIYDFTGSRASWYDNTYHYRFSTSPADNSNLANYDAVGANDVDNQYGVNSWTISVSLSGLSFATGAFTGEVGGYYSWGTLVFTSFTLASLGSSDLFNCTPISTSVDMWNALTWNRLDRGYNCTLTSTGLVGFSGVQLDSNQTIRVTITGADNPNYEWGINTWMITFPITIDGIDNTPPYIALDSYQRTGAFNGFNTTWGGPLFTTAQRSGREYWTKDNVELHLTWSEIIIMTNIIWFSGTDLNGYVSWGNGYTGMYQVLIFTGNMTGFMTFQDIPMEGMSPNYGQTYATGWTNYTYDFNIDVFRIDRIITEVTWSLAYTGENSQLHHATLTLTGFATGNADSILDDEFYVYAYSGVDGSSNYPNVTYVTGYSQTWYSLYHSGIVFNDNWTGYVLYRDRANNTWALYVNVTGISLSHVFTFIAIPSDRSDQTANGVSSNSWMIARIVLVSWLSYVTTDPPVRTGEVLFEDIVKFSSTGIYNLNYGLPNGSGYAMLVEGQSHLAQVMSNVEITWNRTFDFTVVTWRIITGFQIAWDLSRFAVGENYLTTWSKKDWLITSDDLSVIVSWIQVGSYKLFSWWFFVHTGWVWKTEVTDNTRFGLAWYHPADLNADADVGLPDINVILTYLDFQNTYNRQAVKTRQYSDNYFYSDLDY